MDLEVLYQQLRRRKLVHWALAYLAGAWVAYQVLTQVGEVFAWPSPVLRGLTVLLACGLPVALVLAWYHGEKGRQRASGTELLMLAALMLIAGTLVAMVGTPAGLREAPGAEGGVAGRAAGGAGAAPDLPRPAAVQASVAVLPFDNLTGDPRNDHVANGLTEEIISQLAQLEAIKVISRTSVEALKGSGLTLPRIADTLRVRHVLEGSIRQGQRGVRVTAQLIDAATDGHVWTDRYDRDLVDVVDAQEEIARQVSLALVPMVVPPREGRARTSQTAYDAYLEGRSLLRERTRQGLDSALAAFERAIALDPDYAPAHAGVAAVHGLGVSYEYMEDPYASVALALRHADHALRLDSTLAEAYAVRGWMLTKIRAPAGPIFDDFRRSLQYQPNSPDANGWYPGLLIREGRTEEALAYHHRSIDLDPIAPGRRIGFALDALGARRYELAVEQARLALALSPDLVRGRLLEAMALALLGRGDECADDRYAAAGAIRAMCLRDAGQEDRAEALLDSLTAAYIYGPRLAEAASSIATYLAWTGRTAEARVWMEEAFARSPYGIEPRQLRTHAFDRAHRDPEFAATLRRLEAGLYERVTLGQRAAPRPR